MNNTPPDKPGLYWALNDRRYLSLVKIEGKSPFLKAYHFDVQDFEGTYEVGDLSKFTWLGEANAPKEDGA